MIDDDDVIDYQRGPGRGYRPPTTRRPRRLDWTDDPDRLLSLTVVCRGCTAPVGVICRNLDAGPPGVTLEFEYAPNLKKFPAHPIRITDARRARLCQS